MPLPSAFADDKAKRVEMCEDDKAEAAARKSACSAIIDDAQASPREKADAYFNRGALNDEERNFEAAIADYTAAIGLNPSDSAAFLMRGNAHDSKGDKDKALADYSEAIRLDPNDASGYFNRGAVYHEQGDKEKAIADYSKAVAIDPSHEGAREGLTELTAPPAAAPPAPR